MMFHPALLLLIRMRLWGTCRYLLSRFREPRKALLYGMGYMLVLGWLGSQLFVALWIPQQLDVDIQPFIPFGLLLIMLIQLFTGANEPGVVFQQNEIDFLFPAPFTRRQLLLFKIITSYSGVLFSTLICTLIGLRFFPNGLLAFLGIFLALSFVHLFSIAVVLARQTLDESVYNKAWQAGITMVLAATVYLAWPYRMEVFEFGFWELLRRLYANPHLYFALAPFDVFGFLITAESLLTGLGVWMPLALALNVVMLQVVLRLDANYLEVSLQVARRIQKRIQQIRRSGSVFTGTKTESTRSLRVFPRWGGAGGIAWRHFLTAARNPGSWVFTILVLGTASGCVYVFCQSLQPAALIWVVFGCLLYFSIFMTQYIRYDFRADLDQFDWLKQLPIDSIAIAAGMIAVPVVVLTLLEIATFSLPFILRGEWIYGVYLGLLILPFNLFLVGTDNFVFLLYPTRTYKAQGDFGLLGKVILLMFFKLILLAALFTVAVGMGFFVYWLSGYIDAVLFITTWIIGLFETLMVLPALAWAFDRFDVSSDIPPA